MCGITGIVSLNDQPPSSAAIHAMTDMLAHRGPDGGDFLLSGPVALGHRRLSIIDLSRAAAQPMTSQDGRYAITYNGETYNYRELRSELEQAGFSFKTSSDTEVVLHGYRYYGSKIVEMLNGIFAFAILDKSNNTIFLARDRIGAKPLYYYNCGSTFLFSSEIKAFLTHPDFSPQMDEDGLIEYMSFQNFIGDRTLFKGVRLIPAGCTMTIDLSTRTVSEPAQYWDFNFSSHNKYKNKTEYMDELDSLFIQAVNRQLVSDVEISSYLSGGMDSASITAIASRAMPGMKTFTIGFDLSSASGLEMGYDERAKAEHLSYLFKTEHYQMVLKAGDMERAMSDVVWHIEEPRVGQSYPNYYAARLASRFCKVVLAGTGGDELFGGYPWRYYRAMKSDDFNHYIDEYFAYWQRLVPSESLPNFFKPIEQSFRRVDLRSIFANVFKTHGDIIATPSDYINNSLYFEAKTFLHGLLIVEDKLSMSQGLETRIPFIDNDLVDFATSLPVELKLARLGEQTHWDENLPGNKKGLFYQEHHDGKLILRQVMTRHLPQSIVEGVKQGFSAPDASWFKGDSIDYVRNKLLSPKAKIYNFLDKSTVQSLVKEHIDGFANRRLLIWSLLVIDEWINIFLDGGWKEKAQR